MIQLDWDYIDSFLDPPPVQADFSPNYPMGCLGEILDGWPDLPSVQFANPPKWAMKGDEMSLALAKSSESPLQNFVWVACREFDQCRRFNRTRKSLEKALKLMQEHGYVISQKNQESIIDAIPREECWRWRTSGFMQWLSTQIDCLQPEPDMFGLVDKYIPRLKPDDLIFMFKEQWPQGPVHEILAKSRAKRFEVLEDLFGDYYLTHTLLEFVGDGLEGVYDGGHHDAKTTYWFRSSWVLLRGKGNQILGMCHDTDCYGNRPKYYLHGVCGNDRLLYRLYRFDVDLFGGSMSLVSDLDFVGILELTHLGGVKGSQFSMVNKPPHEMRYRGRYGRTGRGYRDRFELPFDISCQEFQWNRVPCRASLKDYLLFALNEKGLFGTCDALLNMESKRSFLSRRTNRIYFGDTRKSSNSFKVLRLAQDIDKWPSDSRRYQTTPKSLVAVSPDSLLRSVFWRWTMLWKKGERCSVRWDDSVRKKLRAEPMEYYSSYETCYYMFREPSEHRPDPEQDAEHFVSKFIAQEYEFTCEPGCYPATVVQTESWYDENLAVQFDNFPETYPIPKTDIDDWMCHPMIGLEEGAEKGEWNRLEKKFRRYLEEEFNVDFVAPPVVPPEAKPSHWETTSREEFYDLLSWGHTPKLEQIPRIEKHQRKTKRSKAQRHKRTSIARKKSNSKAVARREAKRLRQRNRRAARADKRARRPSL